MAQGFRLVGGESHELLLSDVSALLEKGCLCHASTLEATSGISFD